MIRIVLLHTVYGVYASFEKAIRKALSDEDLKIHNVLDEFLASDCAPTESGYFTLENKQRLLHHLQAAELTGADLIVTTCSQLSVTVKQMAPFIRVPIIAIDDRMIEKALKTGRRIALISSAQGTVDPISDSICRAAKEMGIEPIIKVYCDQRAIDALKLGDREKHDGIIRGLAEQIQNCDTAIIAQASGAHMGPEVERISGIPTFTSIALCIDQIAGKIAEIKKNSEEVAK